MNSFKKIYDMMEKHRGPVSIHDIERETGLSNHYVWNVMECGIANEFIMYYGCGMYEYTNPAIHHVM